MNFLSLLRDKKEEVSVTAGLLRELPRLPRLRWRQKLLKLLCEQKTQMSLAVIADDEFHWSFDRDNRILALLRQRENDEYYRWVSEQRQKAHWFTLDSPTITA